jgi:iron uptake system component EfeO
MKKTPLALLLTLGLLNTPLSAFAATAPLDLVGPVSDYKIYVTEQLDELGSHTQQFTDAVKNGDLATAQKLYAPTRVYYESIEPIAELFSDLDASIDSRVDDHEKGVKADDFTGFHRIEYTLFSEKSTQGLNELADKLNSDVKDLQTRVAGPDLPAGESRRRCRCAAGRSRRDQDLRRRRSLQPHRPLRLPGQHRRREENR